MNLRILHLSTDDVTGGAARCAYRLHSGLRLLGEDSHMLVARRRSADPSVGFHEPGRRLRERVTRRIRRWRIERDAAPYRRTRPAWPEAFSDDRASTDVVKGRALGAFDIANLHWIARFLDYRRFFRSVPTRMPVVWTLHDMNAFTGGCHYDDGCGRYGARCGACPQLGSAKEEDLSREIWQRKRNLFGALPPNALHVVVPSRWLAEEVRRSSLFGNKFEVSLIPYGLDTSEFAPRDRLRARASLGIPPEARVVLFLAHSVVTRRKGLAFLLEALSGLTEVPGLFLLSVGKNAPALGIPFAHRHVNYAHEDRQLSWIYSAADLFVLSSAQDNLPATVLEAMACGVPVVAFDVGGVPDMVRPGITGSLVPRGDVHGLRAALVRMLTDEDDRTRLAVNCRRVAVDEYELKIQALAYLELYRDLLGRRRSLSRDPLPLRVASTRHAAL